MRVVLLSLFLLAVSFSAAQNKPDAPLPITPRQIAAALAKTAPLETLHEQVVRLFGRQNLAQGRAAANLQLLAG